MSSSLHVPCAHRTLLLEPSAHATTAGYYPPTAGQLAAVLSTAKGSQSKKDVYGAGTFPAPLVLPNDELALDPECPEQDMKEWLGERKQISGKRKVIYVAAPPAVNDASFISNWVTPCSRSNNPPSTPSPTTPDITAYLSAFYHGVPVRPLPIPLSFALWDTESKAPLPKRSRSRPKPTYIALCTDRDATRIRTRPDPTRTFLRQLCLDDLLDCAIAILPADAYALLLLVQHDLFEDADDFACGRAYGGSRVAVVSMARYRPALDAQQGVERVHAWPACHCRAYVGACCGHETRTEKRDAKRRKVEKGAEPEVVWQEVSPGTAQPAAAECPLELAVRAHAALPLLDTSSSSVPASPGALSALWLTRVCRTASHELGHCFGIEHCVYYACVMQGTASIGEDVRQPPYLCPVDLAKVLVASGARVKERYKALLGFNKKHKESLIDFYGQCSEEILP
ncbi:hypothetical protein M422DRAFT_779800 [Sphaerobolus stellatus SS14]|uniref:Uncharacterized protein n=1 Tax=Sphaerobolus stellatus (strain SS14) TaxID=990650 RepID=A0A0C9VYE5_SPHS4|nr:hypothetical protein M422DRAFT_779800 [Sphaerobolus stellatus SS14]